MDLLRGNDSINQKNGLSDENEHKICVVCDDRATGYHFNAMTCEGTDDIATLVLYIHTVGYRFIIL